MGRRLVVEADGGSRGNPGVAGYGALVRDPSTGAVLVERAAPLGKESNNVAEYTGLIAGLEAAYAVEPGADVVVRMDSKLVVEQMSGRWKIKHQDMRRLALQARDLVADISAAGGSVSFTWIPRETNKAADALSNDGMDGRTIYRWLDQSAEAARADDDETGAGTTDLDDRGADATDVGVVISAAPGAAAGREDVDGSGRPPTRVILVRHGVTEFTETGRLDGRGGFDPSLTTAGLAQATAAGRAVLHLVGAGGARVVTSDLARARQTGAAVAEALGVVAEVDDAWDEQNFGDWDGAVLRDLLEDQREAFDALRKDPAYTRPGGESHADLVSRVVPAFEAVLTAGGTTVVVCHRKPIMVVLAHVLGISAEASWRIAASPGSLTALEVLPQGEVSVVFTNRT